MAHGNTANLNLKKLDPTDRMSLSDLRAFFEANQDTIDANIKALFDRIDAIAAEGYTPIQPVNIASSALAVRIENAATGYFDLPTLLATFPEHTPVRITGFVITSLTTQNDVNAFFGLLDELDGLDASNHGVSKAQMNGVIDMGTWEITGDQINAWAARYPDITITSTKISNTLYFYNFDGSQLLYSETVYYGNDSTWTPTGIGRTDHPDGYYYVFQGWAATANATAGNADLTKNVTESRIVYAAYSRHARTGPTFDYTQKATRVTDTAIAYVDYWEDYTEATYLLYNKSDGTEVTNLSVGSSGNVILDNSILTVHMFADLFSGFNYAIMFRKYINGVYEDISVPLLLIDGKPYLHVQNYVTAAGETAVVKIVTLGRYTRVVSLVYKESGGTEEYTVTSPSVIFNVDTANNTFSIKMLSTAMLNGSGYAINVEDASGDPLRVPIPNLKAIR